MDYVRQLENQLKEYMCKERENLQIKGWYFGINESVSIKAGVKNNHLGGVYSSPKAEEAMRGKLSIIWQDNRRSIVSLDSTTPQQFKGLIDTWRRSSYRDEQAAMIYKADDYPEVNLFDEEIYKLVHEDKSFIFDTLEQYVKELVDKGIKHVNASVSASSYHHHIRNSLGLEISNKATSFSTYVYGDETFGSSYLRRRLINQRELEHLINYTASNVNQLRDRGVIEDGEKEVLLLPHVAEAFIGNYLLNNFKGSQIYNNRSAFSKDDFQNNKSIMKEDFYLTLDTTKDFGQGSYISTYEGVPGGVVNLVEKGKIQSPILDLKYSNLMDLKPTPLPAGRGSSRLYSVNMKTFEELIEQIEDGIIVCDLLGMHTQDPTSGNYSLTAPNCIRVRKGEIIGACKAVISGNFFENIKQPTTELGLLPYEDQPCILMRSKITGEK
ncbi:metallopeptidase TldD-related protein [Alkaliphilus transvaalensis]|uniref:metallopeptidase TldD-related protein n=1 Tax=Alkaliphilus transvaalensis TaxID=114628 RepID=UPI00047EBE6E|nr:metallopeptidase TldD-related protein [Alkaliphilus transvaalensis]